VDFIHFTVLL